MRQPSTNSWKPSSNTMPLDIAALTGSNQNHSIDTAFGSGNFFEGLKSEIEALDHEDLMLQGFEPAKYSSKKNGIICSYGANTNQGIIR
jgi:hypothetical protein